MLFLVLCECFNFSEPMRITGSFATLKIGFDESCNSKLLNQFKCLNLPVVSIESLNSGDFITLHIALGKVNITQVSNPIIEIQYAQDTYRYWVSEVTYLSYSVDDFVLIKQFISSMGGGYLTFYFELNNNLRLFDNVTDANPYFTYPDEPYLIYNRFSARNIMSIYEWNFSSGASQVVNSYENNYCYQQYDLQNQSYQDLISCYIGQYCSDENLWNFTCFNDQFQMFIAANRHVNATFYLIANNQYLLRHRRAHMIITADWDMSIVKNSSNLQITADYIRYYFRYMLLGIEIADFKNVWPTIQVDDEYFDLTYLPELEFYKFTCDGAGGRGPEATIFGVYNKESSVLKKQRQEHAACKRRLRKAFDFLNDQNLSEVDATLTTVVGQTPLARAQVRQRISFLKETEFCRWKIEGDGIYLYFDNEYEYIPEYSGVYFTETDATTRKLYLRQVQKDKFRLCNEQIEAMIGSGQRIIIRLRINDEDLDITMQLNSAQDIPTYAAFVVGAILLSLALIFSNNVPTNA